MGAKATTFLGERTVTVDILTGPSSTGLCKVAYGRKELVRHINRLEPANQQAISFFKMVRMEGCTRFRE